MWIGWQSWVANFISLTVPIYTTKITDRNFYENILSFVKVYVLIKWKLIMNERNSISMLRNYAFSAYIVIVLQGVTSLEFRMMRLDMQN